MSASPEETIADAAGVAKALQDLARRAAPLLTGAGPVALVGVRTRGLTLARRIHPLLQLAVGVPVPLGSLDITLYRDDLSVLSAMPVVRDTMLTFPVDGTTILLVDDVLYTGRTVRAGIEALLEWGRPAAIRLGVLVDRGHREFPIHADVAAVTVPTRRGQIVDVRLAEDDGTDAIVLRTPAGA
jgi:pyrimidine operon attenuation protein/uracil phosphoribosyltransferase